MKKERTLRASIPYSPGGFRKLNGAVMHEHVGVARMLDKAVALFHVEPLHTPLSRNTPRLPAARAPGRGVLWTGA